MVAERWRGCPLVFRRRVLGGGASASYHLHADWRPVEIALLWRPALRDPDDEMVLEVAANGRADRLLTFNERDFAVAERFGVPVVRPVRHGGWRQG